MLTGVPNQVNRLSRQVVLRHPNSMDCSVWRKVIRRSDDTPPGEMGGLPTIGGLGMLDSEDEADYTYEPIGDAKILFAGMYAAASSNVIDSEDGLIYAEGPMEALIECILDPDDDNYFVPDKPMVITVEPGAGIVIPYQIVGITSPGNIPPYSRKYLMNPLADFNQAV